MHKVGNKRDANKFREYCVTAGGKVTIDSDMQIKVVEPNTNKTMFSALKCRGGWSFIMPNEFWSEVKQGE